MTGLNIRAIGWLLVLLVVMGAVLFVSAWTFNYWQAWVFLSVFGLSSLAVTVYLMKNDPKLLERRMHGGPTAEKELSQKIIMSAASIGFAAILIVPALDHRWHWSAVPPYAVIAGNILIVLGWTIILFVFRENTFTSATIEVVADQRVVSTGPYVVVRHPMYSGSLLYFLGIPIALGSWWGLFVGILMMPVFVLRLFDEEKLLARNLPGYSEYMDRVKYSLVPFVW
ncbi:MAG: isoprenylcysteine carboxylmethyltransferase family protein [Xanthobacteraceae bacterium]|jgi:protein-S-isoprenylcysteine O-methyltransferase Ste14